MRRFFRDALFVGTKDLQYLLREKQTVVWLFGMPILFFYFIGTVTRDFGPSPMARHRLAVEVPDDAGYLAAELVQRLDQAGYAVEQVTPDQATPVNRRRVVVPSGYTETVAAGERAELALVRPSPDSSSATFDRARILRAATTLWLDVQAIRAEGSEPGPETLAELAARPRALTLDVRLAGDRPTWPAGYEQSIPGIMVMFTLLTMLSAGATLLVTERVQGLLRRLAATPISRGAVVFGKWGGKLALGFLQLGFAVAIASFLFAMDWGPHLGTVLVVLLAWAGFCASLGMLFGCLLRTPGQVQGMGVLITNVLAALGGCWWPIEVTPEWMQSLQKALPTGWAMDAMHRLISFQQAPSSVVPHVTALLVGTLVFGALAARRFRYQ